MNLRNKIVVVVRAGDAIGMELTLELLGRGAYVAAVESNLDHRDELEEAAREFGNRLVVLRFTDTGPHMMEMLAYRVSQIFGAIDGLIDCSGFVSPLLYWRRDAKAVDGGRDSMLQAKQHWVQAFLPYLMRRREAHVVSMVGSGASSPIMNLPRVAYGAALTKWILDLDADLSGTPVGLTVVLASRDEALSDCLPAARAIIDGVERGRSCVMLDLPTAVNGNAVGAIDRRRPPAGHTASAVCGACE